MTLQAGQLGQLIGKRLLTVTVSPQQDTVCTLFGLIILLATSNQLYKGLRPLKRDQNKPKSPSLNDSTRRVVVILGVVVAIVLGNSATDADATDRAANLLMIVISWLLIMLRLNAVLTKSDIQERFGTAVQGAVTSVLLTALITADLFQISGPSLSTIQVTCTLLASVLSLVVFLSIPKKHKESLQDKPVDREHTCSIMERATFLWPRDIFGEKNVFKLDSETLPVLRQERRLEHLLKGHIPTLADRKSSLGKTLALRHSRSLLLQWVLSIVHSSMTLAPGLVTYRFLQWLSGEQERANQHGIILALFLGVAKIASVSTACWVKWITCSRIVVPIQSTMNALVYEKALRLPSSTDAPEDGSNNKAAKLLEMRLCCTKACAFFSDLHEVAAIFAKLVPTAWLLVGLLGWKSLVAGTFVTVIAMPLSTSLSKRYSKIMSARTEYHEKQAALLSDALLSIRQIKIFSQEKTWKKKINDARDNELATILSSALWMSLIVMLSDIGPVILAGVPIYVFTLLGNPLTSSLAFTSVSLFKEIQDGIAMLPMTLPHIWKYWNSLQRLDAYLASPEIDTQGITPSEYVSLSEATISWHGQEKGKQEFILNDVSVDFPNGELTTISGKTGSGKSLLLSAIAGEAKLISGQIQRPCSVIDFRLIDVRLIDEHGIKPGLVAFVSQNPWMANDTIRENVLFGTPFDTARYAQAIRSCALQKDIDSFEDGDATIVGIKGASLSGGQRWRIALARALYSSASLLLFDDVLSAVDAEVREWIVDNALFGELAKGRTRVLVTHHESQIAGRAACCVLVSDGAVTAQLQTQSLVVEKRKELDDVTKCTVALNSIQYPLEGQAESLDAKPEPAAAKETTQERTKRPFKSTVRTYYTVSGGLKTWIFVLVAILIYEFANVCKSWRLKEWTSPSIAHSDTARAMLSPSTAYILLSTLDCILSAGKCFLWYAIGIKASRTLSTMMIDGIFGANLQWLESTSHGEILTLFGDNMSDVDEDLPHALGFVIENTFSLMSILITSASFSIYETPLFAAVVLIFVTTGLRLISALRHLKSVQLSCASTIQQHLSSLEVVDGIATVRAYGMAGAFTRRMHQMIETRFSALWHFTLCGVMIEFQFGALGALYMALSCLFLVLSGADAGTAGVALSFAARFSDTLSQTLKRMATVESYLSDAQRIADYRDDIVQEPVDGLDMPSAWPSEGHIKVEKLVAGYNDTMPATLRDVSFTVRPGERVGVVGRTGAGKSSLALAFARLILQRSGSIFIDGADIDHIKLEVLRQRLFIIPQEPHIDAGTLRSALDPNRVRTDKELISLLTKFRFFSTSTQESGTSSARLSFFVQNGGSNLSLGQRQILLLARAALSHCKIIIMDEATSSVDMETDKAIQAALRHRGTDGQGMLQGATMLIIAHRLATVADMDKVLVLDDGSVAEFGAPRELYQSGGMFWKLVAHSVDGPKLAQTSGW